MTYTRNPKIFVSTPVKVSIALFVVVALVAFWFRPRREASVVPAPAPTQNEVQPQADSVQLPAQALERPDPTSLEQATPGSNSPNPLDERSLTGTTWGRDGVNLEFGPDGKVFIGGQQRAQWRVEGLRIRLYSDDSSEEHWLDIVSNKLVWEGQELTRSQQ